MGERLSECRKEGEREKTESEYADCSNKRLKEKETLKVTVKERKGPR